MRCPGQDSRFWDKGAIFEVDCPQCGQAVEFFRDESSRKCRHCGYKFVNPKMDFGCASYCKFAEQCLGDLPPELVAKREELLKDRVAVAMKKYFKNDFRRIAHASKVARYAEEVMKQERGDPAVVLSAAFLHDIGIKEAERKYQSTAARYQEIEGPPIAREILENLGARPELIDEVCDIVGHHHHPRENETLNFKCLYDADLLVNLEDSQKKASIPVEKLLRIINRNFLTETGKRLATEALAGENRSA